MDAIGRDSTAAAMSSVSGLCDVIDRLVFQNVGTPFINNKNELIQKMWIIHDGYMQYFSLERLPYIVWFMRCGPETHRQ